MSRLAGIKFWLFCTLCLCLAAALLVPVPAAAQEESKPTNVLLVYDSLGVDTPAAGNVEALQKLLLSFGMAVKTMASDAYKPEMAKEYQKLITVCNTEDLCDSIAQGAEGNTVDQLHIGYNPPNVLRGKLALQTETRTRQSLKLSVDGLSQDNVFVSRLDSIADGKGETYGRMTSTDGTIDAPFAIKAGGYAYVPYFEPGDMSEMAITYVLRAWLGIEVEASPAQAYLLIRSVTPFIDLNRLEGLSKQLYEAGIPFLVSVSPLFSNTDYPAMKRYLAALQTVQSYNGSVLVNVPAPSSMGQDASLLKEQLDEFLNHLAEAGIAPLGMTGEVKRAQEKTGREAGFAFSDTTILFPNETAFMQEQSEVVLPFASSPYSMRGEDLLQVNRADKIWPAFPVDLAITLDWFESEAKQEEAVQVIAGSWLPFADFKSGVHSLSSSSHKAESSQGALLLDGKPVDLQDHSNGEEEVLQVKAPVQKESFHTLFSVQNRVLIVLIVTTLMLFAVFLTVGYRLYKRKYYKSGGSL